jgi:hypothetical protein
LLKTNNYPLFFRRRQLNGLFHLGSKHNYLSQRYRIFYCTVSFGSIRRNLVITFLFLLCYYDFSEAISCMFVELAFYRFMHVLSAIEVHIEMQRILLNLTILKINGSLSSNNQKMSKLVLWWIRKFP